jgi:hypothetical protein
VWYLNVHFLFCLYWKRNCSFSDNKHTGLYIERFVLVSFADSANGASTKDTNVGLQSSVSVDTCPSMEETDYRESLYKKMYLYDKLVV